MKKIMVTGAAGQIGSELVPVLRLKFGNSNVIAASFDTPLSTDVFEGGPHIRVDITKSDEVERAIHDFQIDTVYHLSSILSALAEQKRERAYLVNFTGFQSLLELSVRIGVKTVIVPSSIAAFGPESPVNKTPNDTIQKPNTIYGISKVFTELMGSYYASKFDLSVRGVRLPGIISWKVEPTAGTTDYAVAIFYGAIRDNRYTCFLRPDTRLPMMYMPDAIDSLIQLESADGDRLTHNCDYNVNSMSFTCEELAHVISRRFPGFKIEYDVDPVRQAIADSWPDSLDDTLARKEWGWDPKYDLEAMVDDMIENLSKKLKS